MRDPEIYTSNDVNGYAVLKCGRCPEWEANIDGTAIVDVVKRAEDHRRDHPEELSPP